LVSPTTVLLAQGASLCEMEQCSHPPARQIPGTLHPHVCKVMNQFFFGVVLSTVQYWLSQCWNWSGTGWVSTETGLVLV